MKVTALGGPTALLELNGLRLLTDPTFDAPGDYPVGDRVLTKLAPSALQPSDLPPVDAVLLSHDQHPDNLDTGGRAYLASAPVVLTTAQAEARLGGNAKALPLWESVTLGGVRITRVPAQHGPDGTEHLTGEVAGFVLESPTETVYVSGDNASLDVVRAIAARFPRVDTALLFAGAARTALIPQGELTLTAANAAKAALVLGTPRVVPLHADSWAHFTEGHAELAAAFAEAGLSDRLTLLEPGGTWS